MCKFMYLFLVTKQGETISILGSEALIKVVQRVSSYKKNEVNHSYIRAFKVSFS